MKSVVSSLVSSVSRSSSGPPGDCHQPVSSPHRNRWLLSSVCCWLAVLHAPAAFGQIVTNWVAFNDHAPSALTAPFVTAYNMRGVALAGSATFALPTSGPLTNALAGLLPVGEGLTAKLVVTSDRTPTLFPNAAMSYPFPGTPAYDLFNSVMDLGNADSAIGLGVGDGDAVILTFTNLSPTMRYKFRGTAIRNGGTATLHPFRWTISAIVGADSFVDAHTADVLTPVTTGVPGLTLTNGQALFQSGVNTNGEMVGWDDIKPAADGTFSVISKGYSGPVKGGTFGTTVTNATDGTGYALCGIMLLEYGPLTPVAITASPVTTLSLTQLQTLTLTVAASGSAPAYQWYKQGVGAINGATSATFAIPGASPSDSGVYFSVATGSQNSATSSVSTVTVVADTFPPVAVRAAGSGSGTEITVEFSEPVTTATATDVVNYDITDEFGTALFVTGAALSLDGRSVVISLNPSTPLADAALTTLKISFVDDLIGNTITANSTVQFRSFTAKGLNGLFFEAYRSIGGNPITNLTGSPLFPDSPSERLRMTRFDTREIYPDDSHENYGGRIRGLFIPQVSGKYKFYLRSDDSSELWLNPAGPAPAGKVKIAEEINCCNAFLEDSPGDLTSAPVPMTAGSAYYIEALYKEGGGGDYCQVAFKLEGDPTDPGTLTPIASSYVGYPTAPAGIGGAVTFALQPASTSVVENASYVFTAGAISAQGFPVGYQWKRDGVNIPGATSQSYTGALASVLDDGVVFTVAASVIGTEVVSASATLTVITDTNPPVIVSVKASEFFDTVTIIFDEAVDPFSGADAFSYTINGPGGAILVQSATIGTDGKSVTLRLPVGTDLAPGVLYSLAITNVSDLVNNTIPGLAVSLPSFVLSPYFLNFAVYDAGGGNDVSILTSHPSFPDSPRERDFLTAFDTRTVYSDDSHEAYGARITGVFVPPTTGNWIFYLRSDDSSELYLNPTGITPAGKILLTAETACCTPFSSHASAPQPLTAGVPVYIEVLYKEGVGGDFAQVAAKLESDPTPPDALRPIPGAYLGCFVNPVGASLTITSQPESQTAVVSSAVETIGLVDFATGDGGLSVINLNAPGGPWRYSPTSGSWLCFDQSGCTTAPRSTKLNTPYLTITSAGSVSMSFTHRYSFEDDGSTRWDGGLVRISVNRSSYQSLPLSAFTAGGYNGVVGGTSTPNTEITGQDAFTGQSAGYSTPGYVTSTVTLGTFSAGDIVSVQFLGAWDDCSEGLEPNWEIKSVAFTPTVENREVDGPVAFTLAAAAVLPSLLDPPVSYQWQVSTPSGFVDIADALSSTYRFVPTLADDGALFRCVLHSPGAEATSVTASLSLSPKLTVTPTGGGLLLKWPVGLGTFQAQMAAALLQPASGTVWTPVGGAVTTVGGFNQVLVTVSPGNAFFRLARP